MKKILKIIIVILIILLILLIINFSRNFIIVKKLLKSSKNFKPSTNYIMIEKMNIQSTDKYKNEYKKDEYMKSISEEYVKDNIHLNRIKAVSTENSQDNILKNEVLWEDVNSGEYIELEYDDNDNLIKSDNTKKEINSLTEIYLFRCYSLTDVIKICLFDNIKFENNYYKIKNIGNIKGFMGINPNTGLIEKSYTISENSICEVTLSYEENSVTDEMVTKPTF